jgi:xylulose-5-phosphate/fructose-6-phosphate phosphoketolase
VGRSIDRFHLAIEVIERVPGLGIAAAHIKQQFRDALIKHSHYVREHGEDMPQIRNWVWPSNAAGQTSAPAGD